MIFNIILLLSLVYVKAEFSGFGSASMPPNILTLQMIIDYAVEENLKHIVFLDCIGTDDCARPYALPLYECFSKKGIHMSIKSMTESMLLLSVVKVKLHRVGVILLLDDINLASHDNLLRKIILRNKDNRSKILGGYVSWLLVSTKWNSSEIYDAVQEWPIGVDSDVTIAMSFLPADVIYNVFNQFGNKTCESMRNYGRRYDYARLHRSQSVAPPEATFVQNISDSSRTVIVFYLLSLYKVRIDNNASLIHEGWNFWSPSRRFTVPTPIAPKHRNNLMRYYMNFGLQNSSKSYGDEDEVSIDHESNIEVLTELISLFEICLNVSSNVTSYPYRESSQSTKENNDLVRGLLAGEIDLGAAFLDSDLDHSKLLSFSYPIVRFTRSIYFAPPDTSSNIFLQPFSKRLLLSVIGTLALIVAVMELINYVTVFIHWKEDEAHFGLGEAMLWCISIMCMQGSPWTPRTRAGKSVLLASLIFALIIYNAYSGFITSILSVKSNAIKNVSDFSSYKYIYGCSKSDDNYISGNDELRNFYVKALEANQRNVPELTGLEKTLNGRYAFFVTETTAKRILRGALMFDRCKISELQTPSPGLMALPIADVSPYKRIINIRIQCNPCGNPPEHSVGFHQYISGILLCSVTYTKTTLDYQSLLATGASVLRSILRMWQYGMLHKLSLKVKPPLLDCTGTLNYKQAHFRDVYGAFIILSFGVVAACGIFFLERAWVSRRQLTGIQRRIAGRAHLGAHTTRRTSRDVIDAARLPMKIIGIDRVPNEKNNRKSPIRRPKETLARDAGDQSQVFPYYP